MATLFLTALNYFLIIMSTLIIASAILSWFPLGKYKGIAIFIHSLIAPILVPIRRLIQKSIFGGSHMSIDFSPFIAYLIITSLQRFISNFLLQG